MQCLIGHQTSWKSKDGKILVVQDPSHGVGSLIFSNVRLYKSCEVINDDQNVLCLQFFCRSPGISILMKLIWTKSIGSVASIGASLGICMLASKMRHCLQFLRVKAVSFAILGHQNHSFSRLNVWSHP